MSNRKIDQLPLYTGDTSGVHIVMNNVSNTTTHIVTKETLLDGNNTFHGNQVVTGSFNVSGSTTFKGTHNLSGSNTIVGNTLMTGTNTIVGNTVISGSIEVSGSSNFHNSIFIVTGSQYLTGSQWITGSLNVYGDIDVVSGSSFTRWGNKLFNYGQWYSLQTQSGSADTAYPMKLEVPSPDLSGMYVGNNGSGVPTRIYVENTGLYNIQFSAQLHTTANQSCDFSVWFAMTGSAIANSNTDFSIEKVSGGGFQVAALNFLTSISSGSYVELYWSKTTAQGQLQYKDVQSTPSRPATPSVIVTVTQIA
jgi:hypothetical protein